MSYFAVRRATVPGYPGIRYYDGEEAELIILADDMKQAGERYMLSSSPAEWGYNALVISPVVVMDYALIRDFQKREWFLILKNGKLRRLPQQN